MREMKRINLTTVDRPQVDIDLAGHVIQSTVIANAKKNPNFQNPVIFFDVVRKMFYRSSSTFAHASVGEIQGVAATIEKNDWLYRVLDSI